MIAQLPHRFFIDREHRAVYEKSETGVSLLLWHDGRKVRLPVEALPPTAHGLLCPAHRAWEWAGETWSTT